jgi:hypothetical protein
MDQKRAQEILEAILKQPYGWQNHKGVMCSMTNSERLEIMAKWRSMPGYTCFADALHRLARGE